MPETTERSQPFPTVPKERMNRMLVSVNTAPKCGTLMLLEKNITLSPGDVTRRFKTTFAESDVADFSKSTAPGYCHQSLSPLGLVAEEVTLPYWGGEKIIGYRLTDAGETYGVPSAARTMQFEIEEGYSLAPVLGPSHSPSEEHRAPVVRAAVLISLHGGRKRQVDLVEDIGIDEGVAGESLLQLDRVGAVVYESVHLNTGRTQVSYTLAKGQKNILPSTIPHYKTLTQEIAQVCQQLAEQGTEITQSHVYSALPKQMRESKKRHSLQNQIPRVLSGLTKQGYLEQGHFTGEVLSRAELTDKGMRIVDRFLLPLQDAMADGETLTMWQRGVVPQVRAELPKYARITGDLYYPHSRAATRRQHHERKQAILTYLATSPTEDTTVFALTEALGMPSRTTREYLSQLQREGKIDATTIKIAKYYHLKQ